MTTYKDGTPIFKDDLVWMTREEAKFAKKLYAKAWNEAIEEAAKEVSKYFLIEDVKEIAEEIRKLKK